MAKRVSRRRSGLGRVAVPERLEQRLLLAAPAAATNVNAVAAAVNTEMFINWSDNATDETSYRVERNATANEDAGGWVVAAPSLPADSTSFLDTGLVSGATYSYRVVAVNGDGDSATSLTGFRSWRATTRTPHLPNTTIQAEAYQKQGGMQNNFTTLGFFDPGNYFMIGDMDLTNVTGFTIQLATPNSGFHVEVRTGAPDGPKIADLTTTATGEDFATFGPVTGAVTPTLGSFDVYIVGAGTGTPGNGIGDVDFVRFSTGGVVTGTVFNDPNSNGIKDGAEVGIANWTLYLDANNNNAKDAGEAATVTDANGVYAFGGLANGTHHVKQVLQSGYRKTLPGTGVPGYNAVVAGGNTVGGQDFGDTTNILLAGTVFNDVNSNGVQDNGEPGVAGVTVDINSNNTTVATRVTDANGKWQVKGLSQGTGEAVAVVPSGYVATLPVGAKYTGSMSSGQQNANLNFGLHVAPVAPAPFSMALILDGGETDALIDGLV